MNPYLHRPPAFATRERCTIRELVNDASLPAASLAECRVEAGVTTELHRLSVAEWYVVHGGTGLMEIDGHPPFPVAAGDVVAIPAGASQRIRNTGEGDLLFHCLCTPRFTVDCYEALEEEDVDPIVVPIVDPNDVA